MKKETLLHSKKIQKMITQYKHDMQLVDQLTADAAPHYEIEQELYVKHEVKRGLRDLDGKGVRAGLTTISKVSATQMVDGREVPAPGQLLYRGIPIEELVQGFITHDRFGFEEIVYLLLMGHLPQEEQLRQFKGLLADYQELPNHFNSGVIMKMPSDNIMNTMAKCVLALHAYAPSRMTPACPTSCGSASSWWHSSRLWRCSAIRHPCTSGTTRVCSSGIPTRTFPLRRIFCI